MEFETLKKKPVVTGCVFAVIYVLVAHLSLTLAFQNSNATPIWPPSGLAITLIFVLGKRYCPAIFAGAFIANLLTFSSHGSFSFSTVITSFLIGLGNTFEAFIAYTFFKLAMEHEKPLRNPSSFLVYLAISMAACFGCAFFASFVLWQNEMISSSLFNTVLLTWWLGDFIGILNIGTFLLSFSLDRENSKGNQLEYILTLISMCIISIIIFSHHDQNSLLARFYFIILPIFIWVSFRFSLLKTLFAINLMAILATLGTANGKGPFQGHSVNDSLLLMQCYIGIITITFVLSKLQIFKRDDSKETHEHYSSSLKAQWIALLTFCLSIIATIVIAGSYSIKDKEKISALVSNELQNVTTIFKSQLTSTVQALQRLSDRQAKQNQQEDLWIDDSNSYLNHIPMLESIAYRNAKGELILTNQVNQDNSTNNFEAQTAVAIKHYYDQQKNSTQPTISAPFTFKDKITRVIIRIPSINSDGKIIGTIVAICYFEKLLNQILNNYMKDFHFEMTINKKTVYMTSKNDNLEFQEALEASVFGLNWMLTVSPTLTKLSTLQHKDWGIHILLGLFLSILLTTTIYQSINSNLKAGELEEMNNRLNKKNSELVKQRIASRQAAQAKDSFLTNISHEIRTPMNGVLGALQLAKECRPDELQQYLRVIDVSAKSLMEIIDEVLEYSNLESGEIAIETIDFNLQRLVEDSVKIIENAATVKGLEVKTNISEMLPEFVQGDPVRLKQILLNLLSNALKFTEKGSITINVTEDFNETIKIEVKDTGIGIPEHQIKKVFNHFEQLDMTSTRGIGGAGLGLSICRSLISMMAGSINVTSTEGEGSNFIVKMPLIPGQILQRQAPIQKSDFYSKKVLLCEDDQANRLIMKKMLEKLGLQVSIAEDGRKALSILVCEWEKLDLVLMDLEMPHIGGLEVANVVREQIPNFDVPIVAFTANCSAEDREMCERAGMKGFLAKPVSKEELAEEVDRWLKVAC